MPESIRRVFVLAPLYAVNASETVRRYDGSFWKWNNMKYECKRFDNVVYYVYKLSRG